MRGDRECKGREGGTERGHGEGGRSEGAPDVCNLLIKEPQ